MKLRNRNGIYSVDFYVGQRRVRKSLHTRDRASAGLRAKEVLRSFDEVQPERATVQDFLIEYKLWADSNKARKTRTGEDMVLELFKETLPVKFVDEITPRHVDTFVTLTLTRQNRNAKDKRISPTSMRSYIRTLRSIFGMAKRWNYTTTNPFSGVPLPLEADKEVVIMEKSEIPVFLEMARKEQPKYAEFFEFLLWTGLRRSEAINLEWDRVFPGYLDLTRTKRLKRRGVPLIDRAVEILDSRRSRSKPFSGIDGNEATKRFKTVARLAGMERLTLKSLRATFETLAIELGQISEAVANKLTGHSKAISRRHYIGVPEETRTKLNEISKAGSV